MYHDTISINFKSTIENKLSFDYTFLISKNIKDKFSPIIYGELLQKFSEIGFNIKYLKFNDIEEDKTVYCTYNYQPNFNIFFSAYNKILKYHKFNIKFEYGNIYNGNFYPNNMNFFAVVYFVEQPTLFILGDYSEVVINERKHLRFREIYQIRNKDGHLIAEEYTDVDKDFEQHFFERYEVKVALRKYKLSRLKEQFK